MSETPLVPDFGEPITPNFGGTPASGGAATATAEGAPITPDFGAPPDACDTKAAQAAGVPTPMPATKRKLCIICSKGNLDMAYPAMILSNAALGEGVEVHLFFTFWGLDIINKRTMGKLKFTMAANNAMHLPEAPWLPMPQALGNLPGATVAATAMMHKMISDLDVPEIPEFLELLQAMGCHMWACRMSFDMMKMRESDLFDGVEAVISATEFIEKSEGGQLLFI